MNNLLGKRFGKLLVIERDKNYISPNNKGSRPKYKCLCDCGNIVSVVGSSLTGGITKSCGCQKGKNLLKHGFSNKERLYNTWKNIRARCSKSKYYVGIPICDKWRDYLNFRTWALNNGYNDNLTIDRIDNEKGYYPENCRWVDWCVQANNKRNTFKITYNGETKTVHEWEKLTGINAKTILRRIKAGWTNDRALTEKAIIGKNQYFRSKNAEKNK